jgi:hypothetical protein
MYWLYFTSYEYDNPKHGLEICRYWTLSFSEAAERKVDELLATMAQNDELLSIMSLRELKEDLLGINVVAGSNDHEETLRSDKT